ncbi:MAG: uracil-DNA glycosylase [Alphaproteobacteria bacterium]|nr:MAG: uracil-DNA glycosylase [Alphaproteobacteria bacterium]
MEHNIENIESKDIPFLLQWYMDSGVDESIGDETLDWFALSSLTVPQTTVLAKATAIVPVEQIAQEANRLARACNSLTELNEVIRNFDGCHLKKTATHTVFCDGNPNSRIMLVGGSPGVDEDRHGRPFAGESGQLLDRMFKAINLSREKDFYMANILPWRPPGNRAPTAEEITICLPFIKRHMELFDPELIILLGGISAATLLNNPVGITRLRGKWAEYDLNGRKIPVRPLFHPAYLLRQPKAKGDTWEDLLDIKARIEMLAL